MLRKTCSFVIMTVASLSLSACGGHKNPLIKQEIVSDFKERVFLATESNPIDLCGDYYAGKPRASLKAQCDVWSEKSYQSDIKSGSIPSSTTLRDYRDSHFWKLVRSK